MNNKFIYFCNLTRESGTTLAESCFDDSGLLALARHVVGKVDKNRHEERLIQQLEDTNDNGEKFISAGYRSFFWHWA